MSIFEKIINNISGEFTKFFTYSSIQAKIKTMLLFLSIVLLLWPTSISGYQITIFIQKIGLIFYWLSLLMSITSAYKYFNNQST